MLRIFSGIVAACSLFLFVAAAEPLPLEAVFGPPTLSLPKISPDGSQLCVIAHNGHHHVLTKFDLKSFRPEVLADITDASITNYWWKGSDFLVLLVENHGDGGGITYWDFRGFDIPARRTRRIARINERDAFVIHSLPESPEEILISARMGGAAMDFRRPVDIFRPVVNLTLGPTGVGYDLRRLNVRTGKLTFVQRAHLYVKRWLIGSDGAPVAGVGSLDGEAFLVWRPDPKSEWRQQPLGKLASLELIPVAVHADGRRLLAWDARNARTGSLVALDPATLATETVVGPQEVDPSGLTTWGDHQFHSPKAVSYPFGKMAAQYLTPSARELHDTIDRSLPGRQNAIVSLSTDEKVMIVHSSSDRDPGHFYLLDRRAGMLRSLGREFQSVDPAAMGAGREFDFNAGDGTRLTGKVLLPPGAAAGPVPAIVITHERLDGPAASREFDFIGQAFATRGFAAVRVNWRGTTGFGHPPMGADEYLKPSGAAADLAAAVRHLADSGVIDPARVALFGHNWGGLAAMSALEKPGLFRAWINVNTQLNLGNANSWSDWILEQRRHQSSANFNLRPIPGVPTKPFNPGPLLEKLSIPQFHHYDNVITSVPTALAGDRIRGLLKKGGKPHTFRTFSLANDRPPADLQLTALLGEIVAFAERELK